jgi:hypothetical protein
MPGSPVSSSQLFSPIPLPLTKSPPQKILPAVAIVAPGTGTQFQALNPVSFWQPNTLKEPTPEQLYIPVSRMLNELRRLPESDSRLAVQIGDFDCGCMKIIAKFGTIKPEKIEPMLKYIRFPFPTESSGEFHFGLLRDAVSIPSNEFLDLTARAPSFSRQFSASDLAGDVQGDQFAPHSIWQARPYADVSVMYFECAAVDGQFAAFVGTPFNTTQRVLSFVRHRDGGTWQRAPIGAQTAADCVVLDGRHAWVLANSTVYRAPLADPEPQFAARLGAVGSGMLSPFRGGAVAAFPTAPPLFFVSAAADVGQVPTRYRGITCLMDIADHVVCGVSGSGTLRLLAPDGREERAFVGHCGQAMGVGRMADSLFASRGEDETVRIWDVRERSPVSTILLPHVSVGSLAGSAHYLVCGFHNKRIGVVELRKDRGKAILGVQTQDYVAVAMNFEERVDALAMFGVVDRDHMQNSLVFTDTDGQSRKRVFRKYSGFIGIGEEGRCGAWKGGDVCK